MKVHHYQPIQRMMVPQSHVMPGQQMPQDDLVLGDNPSLSWITAPQPIADVQTHVEPVTGSRLGQQKYSAESFRMCKTLKSNLILSTKKPKPV